MITSLPGECIGLGAHVVLVTMLAGGFMGVCSLLPFILGVHQLLG